MSLNNYIEVTDVTHVHLKQFPASELQPYVDEANDQYEDIGLQKGLTPEMLEYPVTIVARRYLANYVVYRFAEDSLGTNNVEITDEDMYRVMMEEYRTIAENLKVQLTPELMQGVADNNPSSRSVGTGTLRRTA